MRWVSSENSQRAATAPCPAGAAYQWCRTQATSVCRRWYHNANRRHSRHPHGVCSRQLVSCATMVGWDREQNVRTSTSARQSSASSSPLAGEFIALLQKVGPVLSLPDPDPADADIHGHRVGRPRSGLDARDQLLPVGPLAIAMPGSTGSSMTRGPISPFET
jgi:hypothetical protein